MWFGPDSAHVVSGANEAERGHVDAHLDEGVEQIEVFRGRGRHLQAISGDVNTGATAQSTGVHDLAHQLVLVGTAYLDDQSTVADIEPVAGVHRRCQLVVVDLDDRTRRLLITHHELNRIAVLELGRLDKGGGSHLRAGEVGENSDVLTLLLGDAPDGLVPSHAVIEAAVAEIDSSDVHPGPDQGPYDLGVVGRRPERGNDLRLSHLHNASRHFPESRDIA